MINFIFQACRPTVSVESPKNSLIRPCLPLASVPSVSAHQVLQLCGSCAACMYNGLTWCSDFRLSPSVYDTHNKISVLPPTHVHTRLYKPDPFRLWMSTCRRHEIHIDD